MVSNKITIPAIPDNVITIVFHCLISSLIDKSVPIFVINKYISNVATILGIPAISTMFLGNIVQYPMINKTAQTNTDDTEALVLVDTTSPMYKIPINNVKAAICDINIPHFFFIIRIF
ncbi:conserved hypothetical protein [Carnobacterium maltaromaticum]|nr:conserved hypothetical protein [Carnobacterium maltaromaticum]